jgi:hypothetical protein
VFVRGKNTKDEVSASSFFIVYSTQIPDVFGNYQNEYSRQNNRLKIQNSSVGRLEGN